MIRAIQPVLPVGDANALAPAMLAGTAWFGGVEAGLLNEYAGFQLQSRAPGGCHVRYINARGRALSMMTITIGPTNPAAGYATPVAAQEMGPTPCLAAVVKGTSAVLLPTATTPAWYSTNTINHVWPDLFHVPAGFYLTLQQAIITVGMDAAFCVQDIPAANLTPTG